jgi:uncharacterized protein
LKVAVIGAGISGLTAASLLHPEHDVTVFESARHLGGHTHTVRVETADGAFDVDTGFVVFNQHTYPEFCALLARLGVGSRETRMGFSVSDRRGGLEYGGETLDAVFAQRRRLLDPSFLRMLAEIVRFNRAARGWVAGRFAHATLAELCEDAGLSAAFRDRYLAPMGAAIWSASERDLLSMPAAFFVRFFHNHGLLEPPSRQPRWRVVEGGSHAYVGALTRPFADRVHARTPVLAVRRGPDGVEVRLADGARSFDEVVFATHADQALRLLADATPREREVLGAFRFQRNDALLHTDTRVLPRARRAWSSWNYHVPADPGAPVSVTYDMTRLQGLAGPQRFLVTLNGAESVDPAHWIRRFTFEHPILDRAAVAAQARHGEISGVARAHFCGAYWRNGFHEDGVVSAQVVARALAGRRGAAAAARALVGASA